MRVLILGASGLIGWNLLQRAQEAGHEVIGTFRSYKLPGLIPLDMEDSESTSRLFSKARPEATFCCGGWSWVDGCEGDPSRAYHENVALPSAAALCAREVESHFTYFSTSYVFDGRDGPYNESREPAPLSVYGKAKWEGEKAVLLATEGRAIIARTMGIYGPEPQRKNFVFQVRDALSAGRTMKVPNDQFGNATYAPDLADAALKLAGKGQSGIWNLAGPDSHLRRSDFAGQIASAYGLPVKLVEPVETSSLGQVAPRPRQGGLIIEKARGLVSFNPQEWVKIP